ncbi:hypothetical protein HDU93_007192 [Gonapodya sp. JEL0774]|nr:hypothetical protein HDU93_007192 [Gonapodya sp. JEL0774]
MLLRKAQKKARKVAAASQRRQMQKGTHARPSVMSRVEKKMLAKQAFMEVLKKQTVSETNKANRTPPTVADVGEPKSSQEKRRKFKQMAVDGPEAASMGRLTYTETEGPSAVARTPSSSSAKGSKRRREQEEEGAEPSESLTKKRAGRRNGGKSGAEESEVKRRKL